MAGPVAFTVALRAVHHALAGIACLVMRAHAAAGPAVIPAGTGRQVLTPVIIIAVSPPVRARLGIITLPAHAVVTRTPAPALAAVIAIRSEVSTGTPAERFAIPACFPGAFALDTVLPFCTMEQASATVVPVGIGIGVLAVFADGLAFAIVAPRFVGGCVPTAGMPAGPAVDNIRCNVPADPVALKPVSSPGYSKGGRAPTVALVTDLVSAALLSAGPAVHGVVPCRDTDTTAPAIPLDTGTGTAKAPLILMALRPAGPAVVDIR